MSKKTLLIAYNLHKSYKVFKNFIRFFTTFQELPLAISLNSEKLSLFSDSERSEESETLDNQRFRFFALLRMTKKFFSFLKSGEEPFIRFNYLIISNL
jgi:hypothetical protein